MHDKISRADWLREEVGLLISMIDRLHVKGYKNAGGLSKMELSRVKSLESELDQRLEELHQIRKDESSKIKWANEPCVDCSTLVDLGEKLHVCIRELGPMVEHIVNRINQAKL